MGGLFRPRAAELSEFQIIRSKYVQQRKRIATALPRTPNWLLEILKKMICRDGDCRNGNLLVGRHARGNVFANLGARRGNPTSEMRLVGKIDEVSEKRGTVQAEAGRITGIPQPKVSELRNGRTNDYSVERLYRLLNNLGVGVCVALEERPDWTNPTRT